MATDTKPADDTTPVNPQQNPDPQALEKAEVMLPPDVIAFLRKQANERKISTGDMLRIALGTHKFLSEHVQGGAKVQIRESNKTIDVSI